MGTVFRGILDPDHLIRMFKLNPYAIHRKPRSEYAHNANVDAGARRPCRGGRRRCRPAPPTLPRPSKKKRIYFMEQISLN